MGFGFNNTFPQLYTAPFTFGGLYSSTSSSQKSETYEEKKERLRREEKEKAQAEIQKRLELMKQRSESEGKLQQQITELEKYSKNLYITIDKAKNGKIQEDGTIKTDETWEDYKKLPWWKKGVRAASNLVQGTWKLATGFFGYETDEKTGENKWSWKRCLKNAAIAAGCIALTAVPVVGPVVSTALLTTGVVCGAIGTEKGVIKALDPESPKELDEAFQDMGAGLTIGVSSALGLRGLGKRIQGSSATGAAQTATRSTGSNAVTQFVKDATINAYRATIDGVKADKSAISANGFWKTYKANLKGTIPKLGKTKFEESLKNMNKNIDKRLSEITQELTNTNITPIQKSLLEFEQNLLNAQKTELSGTVSQSAWKGLRSGSKSHTDTKNLKTAIKEFKSSGNININGTGYSMSENNLKALQETLARTKNLSKEVEKLSKLRASTMKKMATMKKYSSEVEAYTGTARTNRIARIYDTLKIQKSDITWKSVLLTPLKFAWEAMMIPFKPWNYVQKSATSSFYKIEETFIPTYEEGMLDSFMGFGDQTLTTTVTQQDEDGENVEQEVPVTKEVLSQLEAQQKQLEEKILEAKNGLRDLYKA